MVFTIQLNKSIMSHLKRKFAPYFWRCALVILITLTVSTWGMPSAQALLRQHHDSPGVLRYHSQVSLKDQQGYTWQVLLFKQNYENPVKNLRLRVVGFPGVVEIAHPQPLEMEGASGKLLTASDVYALTAPAANVGEYELTNVLAKLPTTDSLKLYIPVRSQKPVVLNVPQSVIIEWQWLVTEID
jgi:hypothetical protein